MKQSRSPPLARAAPVGAGAMPSLSAGLSGTIADLAWLLRTDATRRRLRALLLPETGAAAGADYTALSGARFTQLPDGLSMFADPVYGHFWLQDHATDIALVCLHNGLNGEANADLAEDLGRVVKSMSG